MTKTRQSQFRCPSSAGGDCERCWQLWVAGGPCNLASNFYLRDVQGVEGP